MSGINLGQFIIEGGPLDNSQQAAAAPSFDPSQFIIEGGPLGNVQQPQPNIWSRIKNDNTVPTIASNVLQGVTFGFGDEIAAFPRSLYTGNTYDQELQNLRDLQNASEQQMPITSVALQAVGGLPYAGFGAAQKGASIAQKALQSAKVGGILGALYGAGDAEGGAMNRVEGAATGGAVGAGAGGLLSGLLNTGGAILKSGRVQEFLDPYLTYLESEAGKVGKGVASEMPDKADYLLARKLRQTPIEDVSNAQQVLSTAIKEESPMFVPEAFRYNVNSAPPGDPNLNALARYVANSQDGRDFAQRAISTRKDQALTRVSSILDALAPEQDLATAGKALSEAADAPVQAAIQARRDAASPLYQALREQFPTVEQSPRLQQLLQEPYVQQGIEQARKLGKFADAPETDIQLLDRAKGFLDDKIEAARRTGERRAAADLAEIKTNLVSELDRLTTPEGADVSLYKAARDAFRTNSEQVDALSESALEALKDFTQTDAPRAVKKLMTLSPEQIGEVSKALGEEGQPALKSAVRAYLQDMAESKKDGWNHVKGMVDNEKMREKLKAALGNDFKKVFEPLRREGKYADAYKVYDAGSSTAGNLAEAADFEEAQNVLQQVSRKGLVKTGLDALDQMFFASDYNPLTDALAQRLFDPRSGLATLARIEPVLQRFGGRSALIDALARDTSNAGTLAVAQQRERLSGLRGRSKKKN